MPDALLNTLIVVEEIVVTITGRIPTTDIKPIRHAGTSGSPSSRTLWSTGRIVRQAVDVFGGPAAAPSRCVRNTENQRARERMQCAGLADEITKSTGEIYRALRLAETGQIVAARED